MVAYLTALDNPDDDIAILRILNAPTRGIGTNTAELARDHSMTRKCSVFAALRDPAFRALLSERAKTAIGLFVELIERYSALAAQPMTAQAPLTERLLHEIGYLDYLRRGCKETEDFITFELGVNTLLDSLRDFDARARGEGLALVPRRSQPE